MTDLLARVGLQRMLARDPDDSHRVSTPLELLFDLVFVVAISQASQNLHHLLSEGEVFGGGVAYVMVFFAVWWAWMNFTWFASAFDTDDWAYRLLTILQMAGVLVLASGVHNAMVEGDYTLVTLGYVVMRLAMVTQWLRAAISDPNSRRTALAFAIGIVIVQVLWVARILLLDSTAQFWTFFVLLVAEMIVPVIAQAQGGTQWHPHHISERYGLFTLILLGESLLAAATAMFEALDAGEHVPQLIGVAASGVVIAASMWWVYFARDQGDTLAANRNGFTFAYAHYIVFAAAGAVSAGIEVVIDHIGGHSELSAVAAGFAVTIPVGVFALAVWWVLLRRMIAPAASLAIVTLGVLILGAALVPAITVTATAALIAGVVVVLEVDAVRQRRREPFAPS